MSGRELAQGKDPLSQRVKRAVAGSRTFSTCVGMLERLGDNRQNLLRVLTYHRIDELDARTDLDPAIISATPETFDRQMALLAARYHVVSLTELLEAGRSRRPLPPRSVLVTFDDAYTDFATHAWPILRRHGLPATLFVPTAYPDRPEWSFWWDRLHRAIRRASHSQLSQWDSEYNSNPPSPRGKGARGEGRQLSSPPGRGAGGEGHRAAIGRRLRNRLKQLPHAEAMQIVDDVCRRHDDVAAPPSVLSWDALRKLATDGVTLGAHTQTHPLLDRVPLDVARSEAVGSLDDLRREIGQVPAVLAYPAGGCNQQLARMLEGAGFELAFTTRRGVHHMHSDDRLRIRRINVGMRSTPAAFRAQLLPSLRYLHPWLR